MKGCIITIGCFKKKNMTRENDIQWFYRITSKPTNNDIAIALESRIATTLSIPRRSLQSVQSSLAQPKVLSYILVSGVLTTYLIVLAISQLPNTEKLFQKSVTAIYLIISKGVFFKSHRRFTYLIADEEDG